MSKVKRPTCLSILLAESGEKLIVVLLVRQTQLIVSNYFALNSKSDVPAHKLVFDNRLVEILSWQTE